MSEPVTAESTAPAPEAVEDNVPVEQRSDGGEKSSRRSVGSAVSAFLRSRTLAWTVALLAIAAAVVFSAQARDLRAQETARAEALQAGEIAALQLTTFTGAGIDEWVEQTRTLATGKFAQDLSQQYDQQLRADLREFDVQSVGEMINSFVQDMDGDEALVFAVLRQTTRYPTFDQTVEDEVRFEVSLQRDQGKWLVSDAKLLSPTPALRPRPFLEEQAEGGG